MRKQIDLHLCDYCYKEHQKLHQTHEGFDYTKKFSVSECVGCGGCMCVDCIESSKKYLQEINIKMLNPLQQELMQNQYIYTRINSLILSNGYDSILKLS